MILQLFLALLVTQATVSKHQSVLFCV